MENLVNKLKKMTMIAVALLAISISMMNFEDLSWNENMKAYIGIIISLSVIGAKVYIQTINKK